MNFIQGQSREQMVLIPDCLDSLIDAENEIRLIDLFVDSLNIADYSFTIKETIEGRPAYHPKDLLKLFIYGTIKRQWGFNYIITKKGKQRASADVGFMFTAYNLRRIINIIGKDRLREYFKALLTRFAAIFSPKTALIYLQTLCKPITICMDVLTGNSRPFIFYRLASLILLFYI